MEHIIRTAEFVSPKHPDKICDQISDAILDECLKLDPRSRVAIEVMGGHGIVTVTGELTTTGFIDIPKIVHRIAGNVGVQTNIVPQSLEIAQGVDIGGAGDQGIMIGYACNETPNYMPLEYELARSLCRFIYKRFPYDGKTQVTIEDGEIVAIVASFQNVPRASLLGVVNQWLLGTETPTKEGDIPLVYINEAGDWSQGGFDADTGVTGRKIVVDAYGPRVPVGGGAFSGKDPSKVDRSAAYMARKIAVDYLKANNFKEVGVAIAYVIGRPEPLAVHIVVDGTYRPEIYPYYDLTPNGIIKFLDLRKPQYEETAKWGHFGQGFNWDK